MSLQIQFLFTLLSGNTFSFHIYMQCAGGKYRSRVQKSEGGTRVEEETQKNEGRACGNISSLLFFTQTHLWQAYAYKFETKNLTKTISIV